MPRQKLGKTRSPEPTQSDESVGRNHHEDTESRSLVKGTTKKSPRNSPIGDVDEAHVKICLHRIQLTRRPAQWNDWSKRRHVFVEYRFLGFKEPFETGSCVLNETSTVGDERVYEAELNYSKSEYQEAYTDIRKPKT